VLSTADFVALMRMLKRIYDIRYYYGNTLASADIDVLRNMIAEVVNYE